MRKKLISRLSQILAGCTLLLAVTCANAQSHTFNDVWFEAYNNVAGLDIDSHLKTASIVYDEHTSFTITCSSPYCTDPKFWVSCTLLDINKSEVHIITWVCDRTGNIVTYNEALNQYGNPLLYFMSQKERGLFMSLLQAKCTDAILMASERVIRNLK